MDSFEEEMKKLDDLSEEKEAVIEEMGELDKKKKDKNTIYTSFLETRDFIYEQVINAEECGGAESKTDQNMTSFIKYNKKDDTWERVNSFKYRGMTYNPIMDEVFTKGGVCLSTDVEEYKNTKEILEQIKNYLNERIQLPTKPINYEKFLPHLILFYWVYEKFPFIPYVHFVGGTSTGKTTAMEVFGDLCYKAVDSTSSLTIASMFRIATQWKGTMLIDEFNSSGEEAKDLVTFLKAGVSNRLLYRVEGEKKKELKAYIIKSPKVFTSEQPISDAGLQSRTVVIKMERNTRKLPLFFLKKDFDEITHIRNKLLLWRLRNFNKIDLEAIRYGFPELQGFDRRVQQIITPVYYFSDEETKGDILEFARDQENETFRSRRESLDGVIFSYLAETWESGEEAQVKVICTKFNVEQSSRGYKGEYSERKISNIIRKILGFNTEVRGHEKLAWVVRNIDMEINKRSYYGFPPVANSGLIMPLLPTPPTQDNPQDIIKEAQQIFNA